MLHKFKKISRRNIAIALTVLLLIVGGGVYAQHRSQLNKPVIPSTSPLSQPKKTTINNSSAQQPASGSNTSQNTAVSGPPPTVPYGNFVSNHHPGGSNPTSEASTCNTSVGATCYIRFTNGASVKKLSPEITNAYGAAIWYWDVKTAGLSQGSWTVTAVAILNGQTKTADDAMQLVVQ